MDWHDIALAAAGGIGSGVAVIHGVLVQRLMVRPVGEALRAGGRTPAAIQRLIAPLLHFSTIAWFLGGLVLIVGAVRWEGEARLASALFVGAAFLFGAVVNLWATRARHPGWMLMAGAVALIVIGLQGS